jgi:hypothetical protein
MAASLVDEPQCYLESAEDAESMLPVEENKCRLKMETG